MCVESHTLHVCFAQWNAAIENMRGPGGFGMVPAMLPRRTSACKDHSSHAHHQKTHASTVADRYLRSGVITLMHVCG